MPVPRATLAGQNPIAMLQNMFHGKVIKEVWPILGPANTFKGMTVHFDNDEVITMESFILESKPPHADPNTDVGVIARPVLRIEKKK